MQNLTDNFLEEFAKNISFVDNRNNIIVRELANLHMLPENAFIKDETGLQLTENDSVTPIIVKRELLVQFLV